MADAKKILCVDDDPDFLDFLKVVLEAAGYEVLTAMSAKEGMKSYEVGKPDLVLVDCMMEDVDAGVEMARKLKAKGNRKPIIMTSNVGDGLSASTDTIELGLAGVVQKPIEPRALLDLVKRMVG